MAGGGGGGGGKRNVNVELNLVPYIDLLSTLICFLLITAVWQQISALSTNSAQSTSSESASPPDPNRVDLSVSIFLDRVEAAAGPQKTTINHINGEPDSQSLVRLFQAWKEKWPQRSDVILHSDSQAPYKHLIKLMDILVETQFDDVGVNTN